MAIDLNPMRSGNNWKTKESNVKKILYFLLCCTGTALATDASQYADPSKPIVVHANQPSFSILIKANPTTGYNWVYDADRSNALVQAVSYEYKAANTKMMGAPGHDVWTFEVQKQAFAVPTTMKVTLVYARPWEMKAANKMVITVVTDK
jgi:inhibitor of cysteine peptidase